MISRKREYSQCKKMWFEELFLYMGYNCVICKTTVLWVRFDTYGRFGEIHEDYKKKGVRYGVSLFDMLWNDGR